LPVSRLNLTQSLFCLCLSVLVVSECSSGDVTVFKGQVGSYATVQTMSSGFPPDRRDSQGLTTGESLPGAMPQVRERQTVHRLILWVKFLPRDTVVDVDSIRPVTDDEKRVGKESVNQCLKTDAVSAPLNRIAQRFRPRKQVTEQDIAEFNRAFNECLNSCGPERFTYSAEFKRESLTGFWK
jgi:hypothetical protein